MPRCGRRGASQFYNSRFDHEEDDQEVGPPARTDSVVLNTLLADAARSYPETERRLKEAREAAREAERASLARPEAMESEASLRRQQESDSKKKSEQEQWQDFNEWFKRQSKMNPVTSSDYERSNEQQGNTLRSRFEDPPG